MDHFLQDVRYAIRILFRRPGFTVVAIIALALGIGANSAIFSVVNAVLLRPLRYKNPGQLVWIRETNFAAGIESEPASPPNYTDWRSQNESFTDMAAFANTAAILTDAGEPERIPGSAVTSNFFDVLGVNALLGRTFMPHEDQAGNQRVAVLSYGLWARRFGADPNIIGATVMFNGNPYTIIGVMPQDFQHPVPGARNPAQLWLPLVFDMSQEHRRGDYLGVIARRKPEVSLEQARAEMQAIAARLEQQYPATNTGWSVSVTPLHEHFVGDVRPALLVLLGAVCFLLLIACANVANLLLARAAARQKEIAIRAALGAGRWRVVRQLLTESVILALMGGAGGLVLAMWGIEALQALSPETIPRLNELSLDGRVVGFTLAVSLLTGIVFGLAPALQVSSPRLNETLKEGGRGSAEGARGNRIRSLLAATEIALALVLLVGAGLMIRSFLRLQDVNPGFRTERVLTTQLLLPRSKYKEGPQVAAFSTQLLERVGSLPGVEAAGLIDILALSGGGNFLGFSVEGRPLPPAGQNPDAETFVIGGDYFRTMGIPLMKGRLFTRQDNLDAPGAVIISETMARRFWPDEDPMGKRITTGNPQTGPWFTVVGIVGDVRHQELSAEPYPQMYFPYTQRPRNSFTLVARTSSDPLAMVAAIRSQVQEMDPNQPLYNVRTMEQVLADSIGRPRFNTLLIAIFAVVALILATVGIYGVISYSVTQRTHEIGIRMALGARATDILAMVFKQGLKLALAGVAVGLAGAFALTQLMSSLLFGVTAADPITYVAISLLLTGVALAASYLPARRATKVDPMVALRYE
ncbi:MAG TPA: ABC transporter permease [Blastocatellia bacterium]|nr:ABC transporter permease [Blastocatellia bacterium]